jgi:hypothetical protein
MIEFIPNPDGFVILVEIDNYVSGDCHLPNYFQMALGKFPNRKNLRAGAKERKRFRQYGAGDTSLSTIRLYAI